MRRAATIRRARPDAWDTAPRLRSVHRSTRPCAPIRRHSAASPRPAPADGCSRPVGRDRPACTIGRAANRPPVPVAAEPAVDSSDPAQFGAIAFTADGSFASAWKYASKSEGRSPRARELQQAPPGKMRGRELPRGAVRGACIGQNAAGRWITMTGGGLTPPDAKRSAIERCNKDGRTRGPCELRTVVCGDGRSVPAEPAP